LVLVLRQDRGRRRGDAEPFDLGQWHAREGVVARITSADKPHRHRGAEHSDAQAPVRERLFVVGDRDIVHACDAQRACDRVARHRLR
jgi:hypothetical protein